METGVERSDGVKVDKKEALKLFLEAGKRGNADAMCSAGAMVYNGEGQEKDLKKAFELYTDAASLGSLAAVKNVASGPRCEVDRVDVSAGRGRREGSRDRAEPDEVHRGGGEEDEESRRGLFLPCL